MPASQLSVPSLFLGVTPAPVRRYLETTFKAGSARYKRLVLPCCGRYAGTRVALAAGFKPEQVYCSDISLFSSFIGLLASGQDVYQLNARVSPEKPAIPSNLVLVANNRTRDPYDHAAAVLTAMKIATTKGETAYARMFKRDLIGDWPRHMAAIKADLENLVGSLKGIKYAQADLFDAVASAQDDPLALVYLAPPDVSGGYAKMFDTDGAVTFDEPPIANFDPKGGFDRLASIAAESQALVLTLKPDDDR